MKVSVIIPAYNAEGTLEGPLESLRSQTHTEWQAIIVDDGSSDGTLALAEAHARRDPRLRVVSQENAGVSVARNAGIAAAAHDWLLFLDADDTIAPEHLERMTQALEQDDSLDAVHCGWCSLTPRGYRTCISMPKTEGDLFELLAVDWQFAIHACVVKKSLVQEVGGFEPGLTTSEDWDLWQRVARTGARFGKVPELLAFYQMRKGSASKQSYRMLVDAVRVLEQGHAPDPRVPRPHPVYPEGYTRDARMIAFQKYYYTCFSAGLRLGVGEDPEPMLDEIPGVVLPDLDPFCVADWICSAAMDASGRPLVEWNAAWRELEPDVGRFLTALEAHAEAPGLAKKANAIFRGLIRQKMAPLGPSYRLRALPAWAWLQLAALPGEIKPKLHHAAGVLLMWATQALRLMPGLYGHYRRLRQRYAAPESAAQIEELFATQADPWGYTNDYEQTKYSQTLELLPEGPIEDVLELACAEGHFTVQLAPYAKRLVAADISATALRRAEDRCAEHDNVTFEQIDISKDEIPGRYDVIVCSEVLYYLARRSRLEAFAGELRRALKPGGRLVMAHANLTADDPETPGYDWSFNFGAKVIGETFAATPGLNFTEVLRTPYYRVQCFERDESEAEISSPQVMWEQASTPPHEVDRHMVWNGTAETMHILGYHRVADTGADAMAPWRVTPAAFEEQLRYLRDHGFTSITLDDWSQFVVHGASIPKNAVMITFDDGYRDFKDHAWPLLERYGFSATVFLVADKIGGTNTWDQEEYGEVLPLLDWREIRELQAAGVKFGSHTATHPWLPDLSWRQVVRELRHSQRVLEQGLGAPVSALAYPWGAFNKPIQFLAGACGYEFGLSTAEGACTAQHSLLALPRLDVAGSDTLEDFAAKLAPEPSDRESITVGGAVREPIFT